MHLLAWQSFTLFLKIRIQAFAGDPVLIAGFTQPHIRKCSVCKPICASYRNRTRLLCFRDRCTANIPTMHFPTDYPRWERGVQQPMSGYKFVVPEHPSVVLHSDRCQLAVEIGFPELGESLSLGADLVPDLLNVAVYIDQVVIFPSAFWVIQQELARCMTSLHTPVDRTQALIDHDV